MRLISSPTRAIARSQDETHLIAQNNMTYRVNKEKCIGCGLCVVECPGATELKEDGKAEIIDQEKMAVCGEQVCPYGAIEEVK